MLNSDSSGDGRDGSINVHSRTFNTGTTTRLQRGHPRNLSSLESTVVRFCHMGGSDMRKVVQLLNDKGGAVCFEQCDIRAEYGAYI